ncbi:RagB/SusD family nutrient uptake outer membrane protein [Flavobacteriaceae bacterium TP-CH-4]|uniref:RagB/SusD family nutrient uptake outer membrane protein n=1 Tax=Pelagihabitans pacificus TaxID=2696054 RepID=A0A967AWD5_9FLAO|nr:RagB/SusD family nutrient uptake outer membrane protein [Pelagihabitans pacificus]NHF60590.1 RagB/SusD family nutrient uptake outer membrane protein [Pelagihabitans pacificus]
MKAKILILTAILSLVTFSCSDELDLQPLDSITVESFYKTRGDFDGAMFAAYSSIQDFWGTSTETLSERGEFWKLSMVITDDVAADPVTAAGDQISLDIDNLQLRAADTPYAAVYTQIYEGIYRTNLVLGNLDAENELTAEDKTVLEAEAKFLRAWFHFQALKMFGTPPIADKVLTDINDLALPNATQEALYDFILADFNTAASGLPESWDSSNTGRATSWAAKSFIGKVNVFREDYQAAITAFEDVVNNGPYSLVPSYEDVFAFTNENNSESIFEVQYGGPQSDDNLWVFDDTHSENFKASQGTGRGWYWDAGNGAPGGKLGWWAPTQDLVDAFEEGDERLSTILYQDGDTYFTTFTSLPYDITWSSTNYTLKKYRGEVNIDPANHAPNQQADFNNERWFRFAELKLLYAEALILGGGDLGLARTQIDDIRQRAGLAPTTAADGDLLMAMMQEKRVELALEPHRWFDIVRWNLGATIFGSAWNDNYNVFPFPQSEVDRSGGLLTQNPGY